MTDCTKKTRIREEIILHHKRIGAHLVGAALTMVMLAVAGLVVIALARVMVVICKVTERMAGQ